QPYLVAPVEAAGADLPLIAIGPPADDDLEAVVLAIEDAPALVGTFADVLVVSSGLHLPVKAAHAAEPEITRARRSPVAAVVAASECHDAVAPVPPGVARGDYVLSAAREPTDSSGQCR